MSAIGRGILGCFLLAIVLLLVKIAGTYSHTDYQVIMWMMIGLNFIFTAFGGETKPKGGRGER